MSEGDLHSWNSLKALPDMPSATHHVNGKGGLEASRVPTPSRVRIAVLIESLTEGYCNGQGLTDSGGIALWP